MSGKSRLAALGLAAATALAAPTVASAAATITVVNMDGPGEGFNDLTPVAPVGGNPGLTLGEQRLNAFQHAANLWGASIDSSVEIRIQSAFNPLTCTATSAVLGSAGSIQIFSDFPGRELDSTWYHVALANRLAGSDLAPGAPGTNADDIVAQFNSNLNGNPACLGGLGFYLGFDNNHGNDIDLVAVLLHEFGHGLGFANFVTEATGARPLDMGDVFSEYTRDVTAGKVWNDMDAAELVASAINSRKVVWDGLNVTEAAADVLNLGTPLLRITTPPSIAGRYDAATASFGPPLGSPGVTGNVVQAVDAADGAGPTIYDACSPLVNPGEVSGNIAIVDRGTCGFTVKVKNAQDAGAIAVIVADNVAGAPAPGMGGADPTIVIPSVRITLSDGNAIRGALGGATVQATLEVDLTLRAGLEATTGMVHLNAPNPVQPGSSISHWDPIAFRNLLMEPAINADLTHSLNVPEDLTLRQMTDIGWFSDSDGVPDGRDNCVGSDPSPTVVIDGCDTRVPNQGSALSTPGCRISDFVAQCAAGAASHDAFVICVRHLSEDLRTARLINLAQKRAMRRCARGSSIP
jgi:hypothetical protein